MARVIEYAIIDETVRWTGRQLIFVGDKKLGPVPRLALCQNVSGDLKDILILHCNEEWEVLGAGGADTIVEAKARAERWYQGINTKWVATNVTVQEAEDWIRENFQNMSCSFCERLPLDVEGLMENGAGTARICNYCIDEFHDLMHKPETDGNVA